MSKFQMAFASVLLVGLVGCPEKKSTPPADKNVATKPATQGGQPEPAAGQQGALPATAGQGKMAHCPSTVAGADTAISDTPDSVVVTVTAPATDTKAVEEIRSRAKHLAEVSVKNPATVKHDGEGDGGGGLGNCPIVLADTTIVAEEVPNGSKLTVKPSKPEDLGKLKQAANDRKAKLSSGAPKTP